MPRLTIICGIALVALFASGAAAQRSQPVEEAAIAASALLRDRLPKGTRFVVVPDTSGDSTLARSVGTALGFPVRTGDEARSCQGWIPRCTWAPGEGTTAIRVTPLAVSRDTVSLRVEHWGVGMQTAAGGVRAKAVLYAKDRVLVVRAPGGWSVREITPEFTT